MAVAAPGVDILVAAPGARYDMTEDPDGEWGDAWYYDDPSVPTSILLCPASCEKIVSDPDGKLEAMGPKSFID